MNIWAFVDYENAGSIEKLDFDKYQRIFVFCGAYNPKIDIGKKEVPSFVNLEVLRILSAGANNLDFHIAYYLGIMTETADDDVKFEVISDDKGFDGVIGHLCSSGRQCERVGANKKKAKASKVVSSEHSSLKPVQAKTIPEGNSTFTQIVKRLSATKGDMLPKKKRKLENWICAQSKCIENVKNPRQIINKLLTKNIIKTKGNNVIYLM